MKLINELKQWFEEKISSLNLSDSFEVLLTNLFLALAFVAVILVVCAILLIAYSAVLREKCVAQLGEPLPPKARVRRSRKGLNSVVLGRGAYWKYHNRDGSRDRRRSNNRVRYEASRLYFNGFSVSSNNQLELYDYVLRLRKRGHEIRMSRQEQFKYDSSPTRHVSRRGATSVYELYELFQTDPFGFEEFVGDIYRTLGYKVEQTPRTNDGGHDLRLYSTRGLTTVECKCYEPTSTIGRPVVQKLVGSSIAVGATGAIVVTTARFSQHALNYAAEMNVTLVNGIALLRMATESGLVSLQGNSLVSPWVLTRSELLSGVPADLLGKYRLSASNWRYTRNITE